MPAREPPGAAGGRPAAPTSRRGFLLASGSAAGLGLSTAPVGGDSAGDEVVRVVASPAQRDAARAAAERLETGRAGAAVSLDVVESTAGLRRFAAGDADVATASRPMLPAERSLAAERGVDYARREVATERGTLERSGSTWVDCLRPARLADAWASDRAVDTWAEVGRRDPATGARAGESPDGAPVQSAPVDDGTVLVRGVRAAQYASGRGGVGYYEAEPEWLDPRASTGRAAAPTPVVRLGVLYASDAALARPAVDDFVGAYVASSAERVGDVTYYDDPYGAA